MKKIAAAISPKRPAVAVAAIFVFSAVLCGYGFEILPTALSVIFLVFAAVCLFVTKRLRITALLLICSAAAVYSPVYLYAAEYAADAQSDSLSEFRGYTALVDEIMYYSDYYDDGAAVMRVTLCNENVSGTKAVIRADISGKIPETHDKISFSASFEPIRKELFTDGTLYGNINGFFAEGCRFYAEAEEFEVIGRPDKSERGILLGYYYYITDNLRNCMPIIGETDTFSYALALLTGDRSMLPDKISDTYTRSGLMPFLCISGLHVMAASAVLLRIMKKLRLGRKSSSAVLILFLIFLTVVTGAKGSVLRAAIMSAAMLLAKNSERTADGFSSISAAVCAVLLLNPYSVFDFGTQLSFLSMLGIICSGALQDAYLNRSGNVLHYVKRSLLTGFYASGFVILPIISVFGGVYLLSPFSMFAAGFIFTPVMFIFVLLAMLAFMPDFLKSVLAYPAALLLKLFEFCAKSFEKIPFAYASFELPQYFMTIFAVFLCMHVLCAVYAKNRYVILSGFFAAMFAQSAVTFIHILTVIFG